MPFEQYVNYQDHPYFTIGNPNQWFEEGYFFHDQKFWFYYDDRHDNNYEVKVVAESLSDFEDYCEAASLEVPQKFWDAIS